MSWETRPLNDGRATRRGGSLAAVDVLYDDDRAAAGGGSRPGRGIVEAEGVTTMRSGSTRCRWSDRMKRSKCRRWCSGREGTGIWGCKRGHEALVLYFFTGRRMFRDDRTVVNMDNAKRC